MGQSQMEESSSGHVAQTSESENLKDFKKEFKEQESEKQKPGESDSQRTLGMIFFLVDRFSNFSI